MPRGRTPKRLKAVARRWASGRSGSSRPEDAGDALTRQMLQARAGAVSPDSQVIEIGAAEADAVHLFFSLDTQWRRVGMSAARVGLDYSAIEATARMLDLSMSPALFRDLRLMEGEALKEFAKR